MAFLLPPLRDVDRILQELMLSIYYLLFHLPKLYHDSISFRQRAGHKITDITASDVKSCCHRAARRQAARAIGSAAPFALMG